MNEVSSKDNNWPLSPLGLLGLAITALGLGSIVAGAFTIFDQGWAYGLGLFALFGGIVMYFFVSWVLD